MPVLFQTPTFSASIRIFPTNANFQYGDQNTSTFLHSLLFFYLIYQDLSQTVLSVSVQ